ncbi:hypothetical protein SAMN05216360_11772 [Methylobacterium phyllostachyos]|uniref:Lipoprotein n=2 Tax=Methylobacterium phyllostachyos TaxID=582672 RepID=A0A1H0HYC3_9HYPH|nr:hypothetical protein SAMN05216360_11772 [Methylobacterium phyllostachyos]
MSHWKRVAGLGLLILGLAACDDKQAQNNTPTKPDAQKLEPQTDQSAPSSQKH